MTVKVFLSN